MPLTLDAVDYTYGEGTSFAQRALAGVSLSLEPGRLTLVLGSTGSGKSTLLRVAAALLEPSAGSARIDGVPLTRASARGAIGLVFQDPESQLFGDTLLQDVAFGPTNMGASPSQAELAAREALAQVGLDPDAFGERSPFALSGGEARRAAIAGVLAMRTGYLLADEPTAGLDASGRAEVRALLLAERQRAGVAVVSHTAEEFLADADDVLVLAGGRTVWAGSATDLIADPSPLADAGLRAPDVLEVQFRAQKAGLEVGPFTLDPAVAAKSLAEAVRRRA